jgi:hypothetical protein
MSAPDEAGGPDEGVESPQDGAELGIRVVVVLPPVDRVRDLDREVLAAEEACDRVR